MKNYIKFKPAQIDHNGKALYSIEGIHETMSNYATDCIDSLVNKTMLEAERAAKSIEVTIEGLGGEVEKAEKLKGDLIENIRGARYTVASEAKQIRTSIKDLCEITDTPGFKSKLKTLQEFSEVLDVLSKHDESNGLFESVLKILIEK